jgi:hypothetical protein
MKRYKLTDAIPKSASPATGRRADRRGQAGGSGPSEAALHQSNAQVNAGIRSQKDRLVDIGRGEQTAGRQGNTGS